MVSSREFFAPNRSLENRMPSRRFSLALGLASALAGSPFSPAPAHARSPAKGTAGKAALSVATFKLKNGLTVLVHEDHTVPVVAVNVWYHVGSKDEHPGRTGFAHLFEHLMFQGSAHVGDDEHLRLIAEAGGSANATTSEDRTNFFEAVPANFLERALFLESDRMGWFVDALTQPKLDTQRDVVRNERRQSYENRPYGMAAFSIHEAIYPADHPYHWLTIGTHEDLEAANLEDVKAFFKAWYTPENASLAIAGDVTLAKAKTLAEKYFAEIPSHAPPEHAKAEPVKLAADQRGHLEDRVTLERMELVWPSPAWFGPGDAELDLLATILGGKSGRLYKRLVYDLKVAQSVQVGQSSAKLGSLFQIVVTARPGHTAQEMEKLVDEEIGKLLGPQPITAEELSRAKNHWEALFVYGLQSIEGRADVVSQYLDALGSADSFDRDRHRYLDATPEALMKQAGETLRSHRYALTITPLPKGAQKGPATVGKAPAPLAPVGKPPAGMAPPLVPAGPGTKIPGTPGPQHPPPVAPSATGKETH